MDGSLVEWMNETDLLDIIEGWKHPCYIDTDLNLINCL